jgi:hypothetical protein
VDFSSVKGKESLVMAKSSQFETVFVNLAPMSNGDQMQFVSFHVEFVNHAIITDAQPERVHAWHPVMAEAAEIHPQFVNLSLNARLKICWQGEKTAVESVGTNLRGRAARWVHGLRTR